MPGKGEAGGGKGDRMIPKIGDPYTFVVGKGNPREIDLQIGTLSVRTGPKPHQAEILIDGKVMKVRSIVIRGGVDERWVCQLEFLP